MKKLHSVLLISFLTMIMSGALFSQATPNLGNDTTLCKGSILILDAGVENTGNLEFYWNDEDKPSNRTLSITHGGTFWVRVKDISNQESATDTIYITEVDPPDFSFDLPVSETGYFCKGDQVEIKLTNTQDGWAYLWEGVNTTLSTATVDTTGEYWLTVVDENRCERKKSAFVEFQFPYEEDRIILTTWDPVVDRNIIIWSATGGKRTKSFVMLRGENESDELGIYSYNSINLAVDNQWNPHEGPAQYNSQLIDSCNNRSSFNRERIHKTLHLTVERIVEPDGATKLTWTPYIGFNYNYFYIHRGLTPDKMVLIDSVLNRGPEIYTFIDPTKENDKYYYQVLVNTPETIFLRGGADKKASPGPFVHSLSNLEDNYEGTGLEPSSQNFSNIQVFPNPYSGKTNIKYTLNNPGRVRLEVINLLGQRVILLQDGMQEQGNYQISFSAREYGFPSGLYYLKYEYNNQGVTIRKLIER